MFLYCYKENNKYKGVFTDKELVSSGLDYNSEFDLLELDVVETSILNADLFGYYDYSEKCLRYITDNLDKLNRCLTGILSSEVDNGKGRIIYYKVKNEKNLGKIKSR